MSRLHADPPPSLPNLSHVIPTPPPPPPPPPPPLPAWRPGEVIHKGERAVREREACSQSTCVNCFHLCRPCRHFAGLGIAVLWGVSAVGLACSRFVGGCECVSTLWIKQGKACHCLIVTHGSSISRILQVG